MMDKHIGQGSQYLWTYRDGDGDFLDGAKNYRLHVHPACRSRTSGPSWSTTR